MKISEDALLSIDLALFQLEYIPWSGAIELDQAIMERDAPMRWSAKDTKYGLWVFNAIVDDFREG